MRIRSEIFTDVVESAPWFIIAFVFFGALWASAAEPKDAPRVVDVERARLVRSDGGVIDVAGGAWLSDETIFARTKELQARTEEVARLERARQAAETQRMKEAITLPLIFLLGGFGAGAATVCHLETGNIFCVAR